MRLFFSFLAAAFLMTACGSDNSGGNFYTAASGEIDAATTAKIKGTMSNDAKFSLSSAGVAGFTRGRDQEQDPFAACSTTDPTTPVDADGDRIPLTKKVTSNCTGVAYGANLTADRKGNYSVTDKDDTDKAGGYRYEYDLTGGHSQGEKYTYKGFFDLVKSGTFFTYTSNFRGDFENTFTRAGTHKVKYGSTWNHKITPTARNERAEPTEGTIEFGGFWGYDSTFEGTIPAGQENFIFNGTYVFKMESAGLKFKTTNCGNYFSEGSITYIDGKNNKVKQTYTCTSIVTTFNDAVSR